MLTCLQQLMFFASKCVVQPSLGGLSLPGIKQNRDQTNLPLETIKTADKKK